MLVNYDALILSKEESKDHIFATRREIEKAFQQVQTILAPLYRNLPVTGSLLPDITVNGTELRDISVTLKIAMSRLGAAERKIDEFWTASAKSKADEKRNIV